MIGNRTAYSDVPKDVRNLFDRIVVRECPLGHDIDSMRRLADEYGVEVRGDGIVLDLYHALQKLLSLVEADGYVPTQTNENGVYTGDQTAAVKVQESVAPAPKDDAGEPPYKFPFVKLRGRDQVDRHMLYRQLRRQFPVSFKIEDVLDAYPDANYAIVRSIIDGEWVGAMVEDIGGRGRNKEYGWRNTW